MPAKTLVLLSILFLSLTGCAPPEHSATEAPAAADDVAAKARAIHDRVIALDTHVDIPFNYATEEVDPGKRDKFQVDLPKMEEGGLDAAFFIVYVGQTARTAENYEKAKADAMTKFDAIHRMTETMYPDRIELAESAGDVVRIHESGKLVACIGIENGYVIGKDLALLAKYHGLGARYITLAHGGHNDIADSSTPQKGLGDAEEEHGGLSDFGAEVVGEMNRLGIMVDVSHISKKAMLEAVELSKAPVIGSHSSTRALADVPRNMDDEQLRALAAKGGVMQTVALGGFVKNPPEKQEAMEELFEELGISGMSELSSLSAEDRAVFDQKRAAIDAGFPAATVSDFVDHIDHAVEVMGIDHVGISSDFDGGGGIEGWNDASETFNVTLELSRRGYTEEQIGKLWSGNLLRVWREVERVSSELQTRTE
ncbi:MAG: dipeptidase [Vicinamibacteria bacterium]